jgi:hypothetical protein
MPMTGDPGTPKELGAERGKRAALKWGGGDRSCTLNKDEQESGE